MRRSNCALAAVLAALVVSAGGVRAGEEDRIFSDGFDPCVGLACFQVPCSGGATTSVSGVVYAPNGTLPLPNVLVYVPNAPLEALPDGVQCARCDTPPSGAPLVSTLSAADGRFTLENVPATADVPLVLLSGKWRRQIVVPNVAACVDTPVAPAATRLPRNRSEGDLPRIAVSTGAADAMECLLRKSGIDDAEFTVAGAAGRVHLFAGAGGADRFDAAHGGAAFPASPAALWDSPASLAGYDSVLLSCEGSQGAQTKPPNALAAMKGYADAGGRLYVEHWHNYWLQAGPSPWPALATWNFQADLGELDTTVEQGFAQGDILAQWLFAVGASATPGELVVQEAQHTVTGIDAAVAKRWIYREQTANGTPSVQYFSFTTPVEAGPAQQCGRVVFTDVHGTPADSSSSGSPGFPSGGCHSPADQLAPQEKALLYAIFDLGRCVGSTRE